MSHVSLPAGWRARILELALALGLGLGLMLAGAWQSLTRMGHLSADWPGLIASLGLRAEGSPLGREVITFVVFLMLLHAGLGLLCWLLARLTVTAYPGLGMRRLIVAWFAVAVVWLLLGNATLYPWSQVGFHAEWPAKPLVLGLRLFDLLSVLLISALVIVAARILSTMPRLRRAMPRVVAYSAVLLALAGAAHLREVSAEVPAEAGAKGRPNIILIGVDSLRRDAVGQVRGIGVTPNIDVFLRDGAHTFSDAITPMARTFGSWTAILSGRYPRTTGARENLVALSSLKPFDTLAEIARAQGYHTVYATDEVRFSNIDASYGFDQMIVPTMGAADFLLGKANDFPLSNMISNTRLAKWWFPATYGNRAAAHTYRPETFVRWLDDEIEARVDPTLLAVHLTLPHSPYRWAERATAFGDRSEVSYKYLSGVVAADQQFGAIMNMLERKGLLANAIVVLLSDHGEGLGIPATDTLLRGSVALEMLEGQTIGIWGHGVSVLSPHQYSVVLALRGYGSAELPPPRDHTEPVSLVDVAPTLLDLAKLRHDTPFDGLSLAPLVAGRADASLAFTQRARFTETGFRTPVLMQGDFDEARVIGQAAGFFEMDPQSARFVVRPELMPRLIADKERAAMSADWLLAAIPSGELHKYVLVSRRGEPPRRLVSAPSADDAKAHALWQALHQHYGEEMRAPAPRATVAAMPTQRGS